MFSWRTSPGLKSWDGASKKVRSSCLTLLGAKPWGWLPVVLVTGRLLSHCAAGPLQIQSWYLAEELLLGLLSEFWNYHSIWHCRNTDSFYFNFIIWYKDGLKKLYTLIWSKNISLLLKIKEIDAYDEAIRVIFVVEELGTK